MQADGAFYRALLDNLYDGVYLLDSGRTITYWNRGAERITGFAASEVVGSGCRDGILRHTDGQGYSLCDGQCPVSFTLQDGRPREADVYLRHKDGHRVPVLVRVAPVRDAAGCITGAVEVFSDNSPKLAALQRIEELRELALLDPLTGAGNRRYTEMDINARLQETRRYGWSFGLLLVDIDHFKKVNDTYGHEAGDEVLRMVARTLLNSLRPFDFLGRWGGEEFVAVIVNVGADRLRSVAERARGLVAQSVLTKGSASINVTVSIGAAVARKDDTVGAIVARADRSMYASKEAGRNRVSVAEEVQGAV